MSRESGAGPHAFLLPIFLAISLYADAQDFETAWMDRIRQELREEAPLTARPLIADLYIGELLYYDSNVSLKDGSDSDMVLVSFLRGRVDYMEELFDATADLLVNYNLYLEDGDRSDHEERFYGRLRYAGPSVELELTEILRRESDPVDEVFAERASRIVSNTIPRVSYEITPEFQLETTANIQYVRFEDTEYESLNNFNLRFDLSGIWNLTRRTSLLAQLGFLSVDYRDSSGPDDADGFSFRTGYRGEPATDLDVEALLGYSRMGSKGILDLHAHARFHVSELLLLHMSYTRGFAFTRGNSSFQVVDQMIWNIDYTLLIDLTITGRIQYNSNDPEGGVDRDYYSFAVGSKYTVSEGMVIDSGLTFRIGRTWDAGSERDFDDVIIHAGVLAEF